MSNNIEPIEIQLARENDAKQKISENQAIDLAINKLKSSKGKPLAQIRDEAHQAVNEKSIWGYALRSTKQLLTMIQGISNVKRNSSIDTKLQAIMENQKLISALIVSNNHTNQQLHEMRPVNER